MRSIKLNHTEILFNLSSYGLPQGRQHWCGVVRFWSAKDFFGHAVTRQRPAVHTIYLHDGCECLRTPDAPERRWLHVAIYAYEVRKEISPPGDEGHKKTRFRGLCSGQVYLPITGEYLPFSVSAFVPVFRMAPALVGAPVLLCVWLAVCSASSFTTSSVSSISCATLIVPEPIHTTGAIICYCTAATLLHIWPIFSIRSLPVVTVWLPAMSVSSSPPILATRLFTAWL